MNTMRRFLTERLDQVVYFPMVASLAVLVILVATVSRDEETVSRDRIQTNLKISIEMLRNAASDGSPDNAAIVEAGDGTFAEAAARARTQYPTLSIWTETDGRITSGSAPARPHDDLLAADASIGRSTIHIAVPARDALTVLRSIHSRRWATVIVVGIAIILLTHMLARAMGKRAQAERDIRAAMIELRLRDRALDSIRLGITIADNTMPGAPIVYANPAFAALMRMPKEKVVGHPVIEPYAPEAGNEAMLGTPGAVFRIEIPVARPDGSAFVDNITRSVILDADGKLTHSVAIHEDVTNQRRRDQMVLDAQKMEDIGQLTGGIAHDFNNLLTAVKSSAEDLRDELGGDDYYREMASIIIEAVDKGADLVSQLMAFARKQELQPATIDLAELLEKFVVQLRETLPPAIEIDLRMDPKPCLVHVDPHRLQVALSHVATNSCEAMPDGGKIVIECARRQFQDDGSGIAMGLKSGSYILLSMSDTGSGMPAHVLSRAFNPFFTTKEVGKGTGLGLSMVYGFVKQSGGNASLYSEIGYGTVVKIYFPAQDDSGTATGAEPDAPDAHIQSAVILVVDDDALVRQALANKLTALGAQVVTAESGNHALAVLSANPHFDLVFSDLIMPGAVGGADVAREIKARWPHIHVLLSSGYSASAIPTGVNIPAGVSLLSKPYSNRELIQAVGAALAGRSLRLAS